MGKEKDLDAKETFEQKLKKKIFEEKENKTFEFKKEKIDYWKEKLNNIKKKEL